MRNYERNRLADARMVILKVSIYSPTQNTRDDWLACKLFITTRTNTRGGGSGTRNIPPPNID